jgi:hypothetical protein
MIFIANSINGTYLESVLPTEQDDVDGVLAAIAYGSNPTNQKHDFLAHCIKNRYRLDIWMRYDHTVPVAVPLLKRLLAHHKDNIFCNLIPDYLHSKVIWWRGYGAYIGSANLTDRAWMTNFEAGVFLSYEDLQGDGLDIELENFFEGLRSLDKSFPLTEEVIKEMEAIATLRSGVPDIGKALRKTPVWEGPAYIGKQKAFDRRKESFRREWLETLTHLRNIGDQLKAHRPKWVSEDVPIAWQIDQFLHAYYYNKVGDANRKPFEDYFRNNHKNPQAAVLAAMRWWQSTPSAPSREDETFYVNAPIMQRHLSKENILDLTAGQFSEVCGKTHATKDHIAKMKLATLGRADLGTLSIEERVPLYAAWLLQQRNAKGWSVLQVLNYVLYEGREEDLWERLYTVARTPEYSLPHYGLNSIAELVGWARPEIEPPRNGRTSKALRALGFDVRVY